MIRRVREDGAALYISLDTGLIVDFEGSTALRPISRQNRTGTVSMTLGGHTLSMFGGKELTTAPLPDAEVLARDEHGTILFSRRRLGKGWVYLLSAPLERMIAETPGIVYPETAAPYYEIYRTLGQHVFSDKAALCDNPFVGLTLHPLENGRIIAILMNYSGREQPASLTLKEGWQAEALFGDLSRPIPPNDALVLQLEKG